MDLLYQRYASPFSFVDGMIQTCRFSEFVDSFLDTVQKEKSEQTMWDFFLHKVWDDISFNEFKESIETNEKNKNMSKRTIETTVQNSLDILKNFNPTQGGE